MPLTLTYRRTALLALALAGLSVFTAGQAGAQNADAVARRLQERYRSVRTLQAEFVQTVGRQQLRGTLAVQGDRFRIELPGQTLVSDGRTMWNYSREDNQVYVQDYRPEELGFPIGQLLTDYTRLFRVTGATRANVGGVRHDVLAMVPRQTGSPPVHDATLYVRSSDAVPTRIRVHDENGQTLAFDLSNVRLNARLASSVFTFRVPQGAEVVDLRG